ncbi:hypothetical protein JCM6294_1809 [Bacteroides pyogenes DSM 20611 = JCM 6294]|uniref:Uncharacterized protein n=1 Tax=Bacteroides pyogenes DSM 20611 = JCM 6294 TaxID=1121100 RepID=W4PGD2_9BACE|nr:hypothetical protein JCM6294_1809 [Bacteroides pyogenes DSM 20611 = JCM 6294]
MSFRLTVGIWPFIWRHAASRKLVKRNLFSIIIYSYIITISFVDSDCKRLSGGKNMKK